MKWIVAIFKETKALFVDDGAFALSILVWLFVASMLPKLMDSSILACIVFFAGFAAVLLQTTIARSRKR